ncbi:9756_t:CDS:10 [Ambispora leptoticha]|uniref:9756_t:CDS:1 n=1 Tax=Ambispora leptoticha TaxID=144679 RepID=A0A9N9BSU7_9GLOM|nr:9756_t:CDS:10 [Ambispora leptoticha]
MTNSAEELFSKEAFDFSEYFIERKPNEWKELDFVKWLNEKESRCKSFLEQATTNDQDHLKSFAKTALKSALTEVQAQDISIATRYRDMASSILDSRLEGMVSSILDSRPEHTTTLQLFCKTKIPSNVSEWWEHVTTQMELKNTKKLEKLVMAKDSLSQVEWTASRNERTRKRFLEVDTLDENDLKHDEKISKKICQSTNELLLTPALDGGNNDKKEIVPSIKHNLRKIERKNYAENTSSADELDLDHLEEKIVGELNSEISIYEDDDEENSLDGSSEEEDTAELANVSFNSFVGSKTDSKNYNWKLKNNESVRGRLINMTKEAIEEAKKTEKVGTVIHHRSFVGSQRRHALLVRGNWIPLKNEVLSKINLKVERFTGEVSELITKVENLCDSYDYLGARKLVLEKVMERPIDSPILDIIFSDQRDHVRLIWGESVSQVTNDSRRKIDLCIRTEDGTKELSHSECAREATFIKILKDRSKSLRTNKCILNNYLENNILDETLEDTAIFGLQLAALEGQLIGIDLLDEGLYFGFDGPAFRFPAQICSIGVLRQTLEEKVIKKAKHLLQNSSENKITKLLHSENIERTVKMSSTNNSAIKTNETNIPESNDNNTSQSRNISFNASRTVVQTPSNTRSSQRTSNSNRQRNTGRNKRDNPDYEPEDDDNFHARNPLYYVSREYAQYCLDNDDHSRLSRRDALNILDQ